MKRRHFLHNLAGLGALALAKPAAGFGRGFATDEVLIEQFDYPGLAHFSYAVLAGRRIIIIDPARDPARYYAFARQHKAKIVGIIETHPHADFVSAHLELQQQLGVPIYASSLTNARYPATAFDEGQVLQLTKNVALRSMYTPGHAPDHVAAVLMENGRDKAVFSGDSLFIGDVGRPDLRDFTHDVETQRRTLAAQMYDTIHQKFAKLDDEVLVYPAHGAGSLCGKSMRKALSSTIGLEKQTNYAFQPRTKEEFVQLLLNDQPFIPAYFSYDVKLNIAGAPAARAGLDAVRRLPKNYRPAANQLLIDSRPAAAFKASYLPTAINVQGAGAFETWLGSIVPPASDFYVVAGDEAGLQLVLEKAAAIGYETFIKGAFVYDAPDGESFPGFDAAAFNPADTAYTYLDVRTAKEAKETPLFKNSLYIPLQDLRQRIAEIPLDKPILVHCASGYRSAAASSLLKKYLPATQQVYDLGPAVTDYLPPAK